MPPNTGQEPLVGHPRYQAVGPLSSGSFGFVRLYKNTESNGLVAIKVSTIGAACHWVPE